MNRRTARATVVAMVGVILAIVMFGVVATVVGRAVVPGRDDGIKQLIIGGYLLRMVIQLFIRDLALFSHGGGGDYIQYELHAEGIIRYWATTGVEYVTDDDYPGIGPTSLPPNLFAFIMNLNGGEPTPLGCTSVIAALGCLACLTIYQISVELGAEPRRARLLTAALLFSPAYLLYTSDMFKDGLVVFFAVTAVANGIRFARQFSLARLLIIGVSLLALGLVRSYLVYVIAAPLLVGFVGFRSRSALRPLLVMGLLGAGFALIAASTSLFDSVAEGATTTYEHGTSRNVLQANAESGSGIMFNDGGSPWGAIGPKLFYMIFSPFPWSGGSIGFQIGKLDTFLWYFILYRSVKAAPLLWRRNRTVLLMLLSFVVPMTVAYATSFANVGLSLRQRIIIVFVTAILATQSWPAEASDEVAARGPAPEPTPDPEPSPSLPARSAA